MTNVAAVAFTPAPSSDSPNAKAGTDAGALATFHNLLALCFASLRRWNPSIELVLVTTSDPGLELTRRFNDINVSILITTFSHRPPAGFYPSFNASLFSIDAMTALAERYSDQHRIVLLDPDIVCTRSLDALFASIESHGFLAYDTGFEPQEISQGLSAIEAGDLHRQLDPQLVEVPHHYGGELYGFTADSWHSIASKVEEAWAFSLVQWTRGMPRFVTEEHLLNYALRHTKILSAENFIRRIWTAPTHRTVRPMDASLPIWHLPSEKHRGLAKLGQTAAIPSSWFWATDDHDWRVRSARICGVSYRRPPIRWGRDRAGALVRTAQMKIGAARGS